MKKIFNECSARYNSETASNSLKRPNGVMIEAAKNESASGTALVPSATAVDDKELRKKNFKTRHPTNAVNPTATDLIKSNTLFKTAVGAGAASPEKPEVRPRTALLGIKK